MWAKEYAPELWQIRLKKDTTNFFRRSDIVRVSVGWPAENDGWLDIVWHDV